MTTWTDSWASDLREVVERAQAIVTGARRVMVLTGAGLSTDSGIPDFRGPDGVLTRHPELESAFVIDRYRSDPEIRRLSWRMRVFSRMWDAVPNAGHYALVELEKRGRLELVATQNVDGLHRKAGHAPERVAELHGTVHEVQCLSCGARGPAGPVAARIDAGEDDPACLACGGVLKVGTVMFGEHLDPDVLRRADQAARSCDLLLAVGTSLQVYPAANLVPLARGAGARVVIVNGEPTPMDDFASVVVRGPLSVVLPAVVGSATAPG